MKRFLALILTLATLLVLAACGETPVAPTEAEATTVGPHEHIFVDEVTPATCFEGGIIVHRCSICGYKYSDGTAPRGHVYEIAEKVEPTYKSAGYVTYVCTGCGDTYTEELPELEYITGEETLDKFVSYSEMQADVDAKRDKLYAEMNAMEIDVAKNIPEYSSEPLLTQEELDLLDREWAYSKTGNENVPIDKAIEDIDLYFRMLKYSYGAYYYYGGDETFGAAKENVLKALEGKTTVNGAEVATLLYKNMLFVKDGHFFIQKDRSIDESDADYLYWYCKGQNYALDDVGYYKLIDGEKWYYAGCENKAVSMQYSLDEEGRIVYSLVRFSPRSDGNGNALSIHDDITLKNGDFTKKQTVKWIENEAYSYGNKDVDFNYFKENGIAYISVRSFDYKIYDSILQEYVSTGADVKDAKVIIFDTRSNFGGNTSYSENWVSEFIGERPTYRVWLLRETPYHGGVSLGNEWTYVKYNEIKRLENDIPILFLTDHWSGSAGDMVCHQISSMKNVTVIGSNTRGCQISGNNKKANLPNTDILVTFGNWLHFDRGNEEFDGRGYQPDIWCNPKDALDIALKFIVTNELADQVDVAALRTHLPETKSDLITLYFEEGQAEMHSSEVISGVGDTAVVLFDGKPITGFAITTPSSFATAENVDGKLKLTALKSGRVFKFRVHYNGYYAEFYWQTP